MSDQIYTDEKKSKTKKNGVTEKDQMNCIIKVLGQPSDNDLSFMNSSKQKAFRATYMDYTGKNLSTIFPDEDEECLHLLRKMLEFNPYYRYSADECLAHPYFNDVRNKTLEKKCDVKPTFDQEARLTHVIHQFKQANKSLTKKICLSDSDEE